MKEKEVHGGLVSIGEAPARDKEAWVAIGPYLLEGQARVGDFVSALCPRRFFPLQYATV